MRSLKLVPYSHGLKPATPIEWISNEIISDYFFENILRAIYVII